jgi:hypothetical protein
LGSLPHANTLSNFYQFLIKMLWYAHALFRVKLPSIFNLAFPQIINSLIALPGKTLADHEITFSEQPDTLPKPTVV